MLILAAGLFLTTMPVAHAKVDYLSLSLDGVTYSPTIDRGLFDSGRLWVPGDVESVPLWIRNDSSGPADLYVDIIDVTGTLRIGRELDLSAEVDGRTVRPVGDRLLTDVLPDATPKRIDLSVEFPFASGNDTQLKSGSFRLQVTLEGAATPLPPPVTPSPSPTGTASPTSGPTGSPTTGPTTGPTTVPTTGPTTGPTTEPTTPVNPNLPNTGAPNGIVEAIVLGVGLLALGAILLVGRGRRRR